MIVSADNGLQHITAKLFSTESNLAFPTVSYGRRRADGRAKIRGPFHSVFGRPPHVLAERDEPTNVSKHDEHGGASCASEAMLRVQM